MSLADPAEFGPLKGIKDHGSAEYALWMAYMSILGQRGVRTPNKSCSRRHTHAGYFPRPMHYWPQYSAVAHHGCAGPKRSVAFSSSIRRIPRSGNSQM